MWVCELVYSSAAAVAAAAVVAVRPQSRVFGENGILRFVTHSRAMNFLASAYESYGRGGSFIF